MGVTGTKMIKKNIYFVLAFFLFLVSLTLLTSCNSNDKQSALHSLSKSNSIHKHKESPPKSFFQDLSLPISIPKGEFSKVIGWLSDEEFIYMTQFFEGTNLYRYNLKSGSSRILYESINPIVSTLISPDRKNLLIHSSPSTYEGQMNIIDLEGKELFSKGFPSVEMVFEWNQYQSDHLFITAFKEDWSFTNYFLNLSEMKIKEIEVRKPFAKWTGETKMAFLDWNEEDIALLSPLIEKEFGKEEVLLKDEVFQFETFMGKLLTISVDSIEHQATYQFYSENMVEQVSFKTPVLSSYSGWLLPNYEMTSDQETFLTMVPLKSAEADTYREGFQFISVNTESGEKEVILESTDDVPFTCSPNKRLCLIGYQFEKLFNIQTKTMSSLF
jgi:hypothetical protein